MVIVPKGCITGRPKVGLIHVEERRIMSHVNINVTVGKITRVSEGNASCEASDIGMRHRADTVTLILPGEQDIVFQYAATKRDSEGDIEHWSYHCRLKDRTLRLTVFND